MTHASKILREHAETLLSSKLQRRSAVNQMLAAIGSDDPDWRVHQNRVAEATGAMLAAVDGILVVVDVYFKENDHA